MKINILGFKLFCLGLVVLISMLGVGMISPFLAVYSHQLGASAFFTGMIFSSFSISRIVAAVYVGLIADSYSRKMLILLGLLGYIVLAFALVFIISPWELVVNRTLQGIFAAMILPVSMMFVGDLAPEGKEGSFFGYFNTFFLLGFGIGPLLGGVIYDNLSLNLNFFVIASLNLLSFLIVLFFIKDLKKVVVSDQNTLKQQIIVLKDIKLLFIFIARVFSAFSLGCFVTFLPILAISKGFSNTQLGWLLASSILVSTGLQTPCGKIADHMSRRGLTAIGFILSAISIGFLPFANNFKEFLFLCILKGLATGLAFPALIALIVEQGRKSGVGMGIIMSTFSMAMSLGVAIGPLSAGILVDCFNIYSAFWVAGFSSLIAAILIFWVK